MVEGDLWVHARTDLADLYRDALTLRQVYVRWSGLPEAANIWDVLREEIAREDAKQKVRDIDDVMRMVGG